MVNNEFQKVKFEYQSIEHLVPDPLMELIDKLQIDKTNIQLVQKYLPVLIHQACNALKLCNQFNPRSPQFLDDIIDQISLSQLSTTRPVILKSLEKIKNDDILAIEFINALFYSPKGINSAPIANLRLTIDGVENLTIANPNGENTSVTQIISDLAPTQQTITDLELKKYKQAIYDMVFQLLFQCQSETDFCEQLNKMFYSLINVESNLNEQLIAKQIANKLNNQFGFEIGGYETEIPTRFNFIFPQV